MNWRSQSLALAFGMLMILIIFGDAAQVPSVGNLDTIFGEGLWPLMDIVYPLASIAVFLLYGKSRGRLQFKRASILLLLAFLASLVIIQFDDIFVVLQHTIILPQIYWTVARLVYLFAAPITFLAFGLACENLNRPGKTKSPLARTP